jgi:hypothetical protein
VAGAGASAIATIPPFYTGSVLNGSFDTGYFNQGRRILISFIKF